MKKYTKIALIAGIILIAVFIAMPEAESEDTPVSAVSAETAAERFNYFGSHGWDVEEMYSQKVIIPEEFNSVYEQYAVIQDKQGLPLREHAGEEALLYVYKVKNYSPDGNNLLAELLVCDNVAVASMVYSEDQGSLRLNGQ